MPLDEVLPEEEMAILIVDDVPENIQILGKVLRGEGYKIAPAANGKRALEMIPKVKPDLVLMDVMMPVMDGFEACRRMKESAEMKDIPVIFLSAKGESEDVIQGFRLGAVDYIQKPFNSEELLVRVRNHLELVQSRRLIIRYMDEMGRQNALLQELALTDGLTQLSNHSHSLERLRQEEANARRYGNPLTVVMLDIDFFKQVNDTHGHPVGDRILKGVADIIRSNAREGDIAGRYGGEEFILILPNTGLEGGVSIAERIRQRVAESSWEPGGLGVTISGGVSSLDSCDDRELIGSADERLYRAKSLGRNRIVACSEESE
jgi:diguanylate cyclase (GGDEF)-like protein